MVFAAARDRLADVLGGAEPPAASSVQLKASADALRLEVDGIGRVEFPVPEEQARELCRIGQPARFGRGEETLTDSRIRDTWEVPKNLVSIEWDGDFVPVLDAVCDGLGIQPGCDLTAEFHSMLVYEEGQFFVTHQDSEKDDAMIGTLVVTLPSVHTGGELVVEHNGEDIAYSGTDSALSLVAFYSDCRHEVLPVTSGYRITFTYNLLLTEDNSGAITADDALLSELARCLDEHFTTPVTVPYGRGEANPPGRLVYLLDHEYTARGLAWSRLKGADAGRASLLRSAADKGGCEAVLALTDVQETWSAFESGPDYGYRYFDGDLDDGWDDESDPDECELQELIESSIKLTRWTIGSRAEGISLAVADAEVCASTRSVDLKAYASEYEGYMGNYGNTMDRWYRRAAIVVWPRDRDFANRAEASPDWALDELIARVRAGDQAGACAAAATVRPFWDAAVRANGQAGFFGTALRTATALDDVEIAEMLLRPFRIECLSLSHVASLVMLAGHFGEQWLGELVSTWFGDGKSWLYGSKQARSEWIASLPGLCAALHSNGNSGAATSRHLVDLAWGWLGNTIQQALATQSLRYRDKELSDVGESLAAVLMAAAKIGAADLRDQVVEFVCHQGDEVIVCMMSALRSAGAQPAETRRDGGFDTLAADCAIRLKQRLATPPRADDDWSIPLPDGCGCELCDTLGTFLNDPTRRTYEWPLAKQRRRHVHDRIDASELPVRHQTRRTGRPYTLVLVKTQALFEREAQDRRRDEADLRWLSGEFERADGA
ncbi:2OG-Fe(II) oxygenase [Haloechinothrix salitolerans]|uniref:2OG-Fe(II) oxygenase n=1 Tax=Haloechinothrix salitolerans TaxID=926830 RepID=A0ABW2BYB6_9PSEU